MVNPIEFDSIRAWWKEGYPSRRTENMGSQIGVSLHFGQEVDMKMLVLIAYCCNIDLGGSSE
jgi:hypothetical protein